MSRIILGQVNRGDTFIYQGVKVGTWHQVQMTSGQMSGNKGYISEAYIAFN